MEVDDGLPSSSTSDLPNIIGDGGGSVPLAAWSSASFGVPMSGSGRRGSNCMGVCGDRAPLLGRARALNHDGSNKVCDESGEELPLSFTSLSSVLPPPRCNAPVR